MLPWDHPRVCGEKSGLPVSVPTRMGSPPRMRGKDVKQAIKIMMQRITPAYAGKSALRFLMRCQKWDHPRVCGEKNAYYKLGQQKPGSPPRMRGKVCIPLWCSVTAGITPAYAGKRDKPLVIVSTITDHPRVCGEKQHHVTVRAATLGSPPRMRGKGVVYVFVSEKFGITPAYAGKSHRTSVCW